MTLEEENAALRAELAAEREERRRMQRALEDAMAAVRAAAEDRKAIEARRATDRERRRRADRARLERVISRDIRAADSRESHVSAPPPPSVPSSPSPLSSPPPLSSSKESADAAPSPGFELTPQKPGRKKPTPAKTPGDPRHAPLVKALTEAGWPFDGPKDAAHVKALLVLADQQPATSGDKAAAEVLRRAAIAWRQFPGFNSARTLGDFRAHWGRFERPVDAEVVPLPQPTRRLVEM